MPTDTVTHRTQIIVALIGVAGVLGAAVIARWGGPTGGGSTASPERVATSATTAPVQFGPAISGQWIDNWGTEYIVTQTADRFHFTASGNACRGPFLSQGAGTVIGLQFKLSYRTGYSTGSCSGAISEDGGRTTSDCLDSACGAFQAVSQKR